MLSVPTSDQVFAPQLPWWVEVIGVKPITLSTRHAALDVEQLSGGEHQLVDEFGA